MIRSYSPRHRGPYQDFHFFAGTQRHNNFEPRSFASPAPPAPAAPLDLLVPAASAAAPEPAPPPRPAQPQRATHETNTPTQPENARLGTLPNEPEPPGDESVESEGDVSLESEDEPSTEALERALEYLAKTDGLSAAVLQEPPVVDQFSNMRAEPVQQPSAAPKHKSRNTVSSSRAKRRPRRARPSRISAPRRSGARRKPASDSLRAQHESQCTICSHPYCSAIENEFMHWHAINHIAYDYKVSRSAIYRHAYAERLFARRNHELRFALGHLIERAQDVDPTADTIVRAIHLFARINNDGECIEPPAHVIVSSGGIHRETAAGNPRRPVAISLDSPALANVIDVPPKKLPARSKARAKGGTLNRPSRHASH